LARGGPLVVVEPEVRLVFALSLLSLVAMMGLAFLMSLCSESDAFVAASFVGFWWWLLAWNAHEAASIGPRTTTYP
jgi:hypothetical protein